MPVDFESWWLEHDYFPSGLDRTSHPLWKPYRKLYRSLNSQDLTLIEELRLELRGYLLTRALLKPQRKRKTSNVQVFKKNERLFKRFGRFVADTLGANIGNGIDQVIERAFRDFQAVIELESGVAKGRSKDTWKSLIQEVIPIVPKLTGLSLKYYPDPSPLIGRTPEQWQTFILLAMVNYLEQKTQRPHYREAVDILNAQVPRLKSNELKSNDRLSYSSARARVTQFKQSHPNWRRDVKALYDETRQFTAGTPHSVRPADPTC
jgi:hypothetical protein